MTNTLSPAATNKIFTTVRNLDGWARETATALVEIPTDALVEAAQIAYDAIKSDRFRSSARPKLTRAAWLTGNGILDESRTRELAVNALCNWAHDQRMQAFSAQWKREQLDCAVASIVEELA